MNIVCKGNVNNNKNITKYFVITSILSFFLILSFNKSSQGQETSDAPYQSLMFKKEELKWINGAIKAHEQGIDIGVLLPEMFPIKKPQEEIKEVVIIPENEGEPIIEEEIEVEMEDFPEEAPAFYLKSILYFDENNWTIWLNDQKISKGDSYKNLNIIDVTSNEVVILWKDTDLDKIFPNWKKTFYSLGEGKFASNNKNVVINMENEDVSFILQPNQTLVTDNMKIIEGKGEAVSIANPADNINMGSELLGEASDMTEEERAKSLLRGHNPADGIENMQKYMMQLNMLKSIMDAKSQ